MITRRIELSLVRRLRRAVDRRVVSTGEDTVLPILVQNIRIEEHADSCIRCRHGVTEVVGGLLQAGGSADRGVIGLRHWEGLHAHVGSNSWGRADGGVVKEGGASPAWEGLGVGCVGAEGSVSISYSPRRTDLLGTSLNDVKLALPLTDVGGIDDRKGGAEECALDSSDGGRVGAGSIVWCDRWIALEV
jgi:hypothetical protein